jgi:signal peptidase I
VTDQPDSPAPNGESAPDRNEIKREIVDFAKLVVWFLAIFLVLRTYVLEGYEVQGPSMLPTLENNQRILVFKLPHRLSEWGVLGDRVPFDPGDIIVFDSPDAPGKRYVKRLIAVGPKADEGNTVEADTETPDAQSGVKVQYLEGDIFVDNHKVEETYLSATPLATSDEQELMLGPGEYYVLGDNRRVSKDSRSFAAIHDRAIIGKAVFRFWPLNRISILQ